MLDPEFQRGIRLLNGGEYFRAHEVLEDVWRGAAAADKKFLQGMIQLAVGLHHAQNNNRRGALSVLSRARGNLLAYAPAHDNVNVSAICDWISRAAAAIEAGDPPPAPRIEVQA